MPQIPQWPLNTLLPPNSVCQVFTTAPTIPSTVENPYSYWTANVPWHTNKQTNKQHKQTNNTSKQTNHTLPQSHNFPNHLVSDNNGPVSKFDLGRPLSEVHAVWRLRWPGWERSKSDRFLDCKVLIGHSTLQREWNFKVKIHYNSTTWSYRHKHTKDVIPWRPCTDWNMVVCVLVRHTRLCSNPH